MYILLYFFIGFIIASLLIAILEFEDEFNREHLPIIIMIFCTVLWPVVLICIFLYYPVKIVYKIMSAYIYWLSNMKSLASTFLFVKKVYFLYGENGSQTDDWGQDIKKEYKRLVMNGEIQKINTEKRIQYIFDDKFTKQFYRKIKYPWLPW